MTRRNRVLIPLTLVTAIAIAACTTAEQDVETSPAGLDLDVYEQRGREIAASFQSTLKTELVAALSEGGPGHAVGVCSIRAPEVAAELSLEGVDVGRATHKPRNPANEASGWLEPVVASFVASNGEGGPAVVALPDGRVGYAEPIRMQEPCLMCHGDAIDESVREEIEAAYPEDRATGFEAGEFRGVIWVTMPARPES